MKNIVGLSTDKKLYIPANGVDLKKWAVVACDQYTSQPEYWENVEKIVGDSPSTLHIVYPEVYLGESAEKRDARTSSIHRAMERYVSDETVLVEAEWPVYVERKVLGRVHRGVVVAIDLENYEFTRCAATLIRPTEETVIERIPPRVRIRRGAPLEAPHIVLLIDDEQCHAIEPLGELANKGKLKEMYSTELMMGGGSVRGFAVEGKERETFFDALAQLAEPERQRKKYGETAVKNPLVYAVGDGNHSLATAKAIWEEFKKDPSVDLENDPRRYALVELCNVHDETLVFEPIHRIIEGAEASVILDKLVERFGDRISITNVSKDDIVSKVFEKGNSSPHTFGFICGDTCCVVSISNTEKELVVGTLQPVLDSILSQLKVTIDYVHGEDVVMAIGGRNKEHCGIILPPMQKSELFPTVVKAGMVPRKTFSMGHAAEKRFYMECRKIY